MTDRTTSVTSWIEVSRGRIEVQPGGETEVLTISVHPYVELVNTVRELVVKA